MASWDAAYRTWWGNDYHRIPRRNGAADTNPDKEQGRAKLQADIDALRAEEEEARKQKWRQ
jgi:hypothetical protein